MDKGSNLLEKPWRNLGHDCWSSKTYNQLKSEIVTHELTEDAGIDYINVLLVGDIGAGKSSFFNSVESVFDGFVTSRANAGLVEKSLTTQYRQYFVSNGNAKDSSNKNIKFRFCDSMGLEGGNVGLDAKSMAKIMDGHVENLAELQEATFVRGGKGYREIPTESDRIHCVVFVINAEQVSAMEDGIVEKIKEIRKEADLRHLYPLIVLTKIDTLCEETEKDTANAFKSKIIRDKVEEVSDLFGIKANQIHPMRNYCTETECDRSIDILTLRALRQILRYSKTYLKDVIDREEEENKILDKKLAERQTKKGFSSEKYGRGHEKNIQEGSVAENFLGNSTGKTSSQWRDKEGYNCEGAPSLLSLTAECQNKKGFSSEKYGSGHVKNIQEGSVAENFLENSAGKTSSQWRATEGYNCEGAPGLLSLTAGELVTKIAPEEYGWVRVKNSRGQEGSVPVAKLVIPSAMPPKQWKAIRSYQSRGAPGLLSLAMGETVTKIKPEQNGWVTVRNCAGQEGKVQAALLVELTADDPQKTPRTQWEANKDYNGPSAPGFISLKFRELVSEVEPAKDGWIKVQNEKCQEGFVPVDALKKKKWRAKADLCQEGLISLKKGELLDEVESERERYVNLRNNEGVEGWAPVDILVPED